MKIAVRVLGILGIIWNAFLTLVAIYLTHLYFSLSGTGQLPPTDSISGSGFYIAVLAVVVGLIGLIASIALVIPRKWGFVLFYIYTLFSIILNWTQGATLTQWIPIAILVIVSVFLAFQQRKLFLG